MLNVYSVHVIFIFLHPFSKLMNAGDSHIFEVKQQTTELRMPDNLAGGG